MNAQCATPQAGPGTAARPSRVRWCVALAGQFLLVFGAIALSGPGRIDIVDGQTRYEVARSLVEHGDSVVRDPYAWFAVYPGRGGAMYTDYRFPQTAGGVVAVLLADATGPVSETRRHFFFALTSAFAGAVLAVTYSVWFRALGHGPRASLAWATAGIFCTPNWYYATCTFDDILGTATVVLAVAVAWLCRERRPLLGGAVAGLLIGWAFNCKPPLVFFALPVLAAGYSAAQSRGRRLAQVGLVGLGILLGGIGYKGYQDYKFPPGTSDPQKELEKIHGPIWTSNPLPGLAGLALSPSAGALWYCPPLLLAFHGFGRWRRGRPWFCASVLAASLLFVLFICFLTFFKGEPSWGPRYLTPLFALWWVFVPAAVGAVRTGLIAGLLGLGVVVQLLGLSVDPQRLFLQAPLGFNYYVEEPWLGFHSRASHLLQRPRELLEVLSPGRPPVRAVNPGPLPTHAGGIGFIFPLFVTGTVGQMRSPNGLGPLGVVGGWKAVLTFQTVEVYQTSVDYYLIFHAPRPWWAWQGELPADRRPVALGKTLALLLCVTAVGFGLMLVCSRRAGTGLPRGPTTCPGVCPA